MEDFGFQIICEVCLATRGVLDSEQLPARCPECGGKDSWRGPFATRFEGDRGEQLVDSPFYRASSSFTQTG